MQEIRALVNELKKSPLATFCGLLVAAVVYLSMLVLEMQEQRGEIEAAYRAEIVATEKRCAKEMDDLRKEQIAVIQAALDAQKKMNEKMRKW